MKVLAKQTVIDLALQERGTISAAFAVANANDVSITDTLLPDIDYLIPEDAPVARVDLKYIHDNEISPASNDDGSLSGIGFWAIGINFIIAS